MKNSDDRIDASRRRLLRRLGLAGAAAYVAPALTAFGTASASGVSSASRPSGPSRPARAVSRPSRPAVRQQPAQPRPQAARPAAPPPEMLLFLPAGIGADAVEALGYPVLASRPNAALAGIMLRLALPSGRTAEQARAELAAALPGALADANHLYRPDEFLCSADACAAHAMVGWTGWPSAHSPRIGMIDTGINTEHDALAGQKLTIHQAELGERASAGRQHGTAIAALLIGRMESRVPGLLPHAHLIAVEAFHRDAAGEAADAFSLAEALDLLLEADVSVINMSFSGPANAVLEQVVARAGELGVGMVAAAGNGGPGGAPAYPAAWPQVLAVTAVDHRLAAYRQANRGDYIGLSAPGVNLWTAASISGGRLRSGTSYAAPFVTAALAVERTRNPEHPISEAVARLVGCAQDLGPEGHDPTYGHGLVQAPGQCTADETSDFFLSGE